MAQTKTARSNRKSTPRRKSSNRSRAKGSASKSRSSGSSAAASRPRARSKSSPSTAKRSPSSSRQSASGAAGQAAPSPIAKAAKRAKTPAIAGGAALVGLAGGLAMRNGRRRNGLAAMSKPRVNLSLPKPKGSTVKVLGGAAKEIAKGGYKIGQLTSEVQKMRKAVEAQDSGK
jgi:hypothetical protein